MTTERAGRPRLVATLANLVFAVAMALATAGCATTTPSATSGVVTIVDNILAAKVPTDVRSDGVLKVATDSSHRPSVFYPPGSKQLAGLDVELLDAVATKLGLQVEYVPMKPAEILPAVAAARYEVGMSSFTITDTLKRTVTAVSYYRAGTRWATQRGNPGRLSPQDVCGKRVAVVTGTAQATNVLPAKQQDCKKNNKPDVIVDPYAAQDDATKAVATGKDDVLMGGAATIAYEIKHAGGKLEPLGGTYDSAPCAYVVKKEQTELAKALADSVTALIAEGTYRRILDKWGVGDGAIATPAVNP